MKRRLVFVAAGTAAAAVLAASVPAATNAAGATGDWVVTSGELRQEGDVWRHSSNVFRVVSLPEFSYQNVALEYEGTINKFTSAEGTPEVAWDGVHLFLRYASQYNLYYATVARRDGAMVLKKKCEGGPSNNGTYYTLATGESPARVGEKFTARAGVEDVPSGGVRLWVQVGESRLEAIDDGIGCATISAGRVGVRSDNADVTTSVFKTNPECEGVQNGY